MYIARKFRKLDEPDYEEMNSIWAETMKVQEPLVVFPDFFDTIIESFKEDSEIFIYTCEHFNKSENIVPAEFNELPTLTKIATFVSCFKNIFTLDELHTFLLDLNISLERIKQRFTHKQYIQYITIIHIYSRILQSIGEYEVTKYSFPLSKMFTQALIPQDSKIFTSFTVNFETIYISPCFIIDKEKNKTPAFIKLLSDGTFRIFDVVEANVINILNPSKYTVIQDDCILEIFLGGITPEFSIEFPNKRAAEIVLGIYISDTPIGFNHVTTFLSSISSLNNIEKFFKNVQYVLPPEVNSNLDQIISSNGCQLLFYAMLLPPEETKISDKNALFFVSLIGNKIYPFYRCIIENNLEELQSNNIILRQNSLLTTVTSCLLKEIGKTFLANIVLKLNAIVNNTSANFQSNDMDMEQAISFAQNVFHPTFNAIVNSVSYLPNPIKSILRCFFIRALNHCVNEVGPIIVIPNLFLLRFVFPEFTAQNKENMKFISKISQSIMNVFYFHGWEADRSPPELVKLNEKYVYPLFASIPKFIQDLITVSDNDLLGPIPCPGDIKINLIDYFSPAAERFTSLNLESANSYVQDSFDLVSITQMIEESTFDIHESCEGVVFE
ncbi:hypothetical protein TVAG_413840 [Trichomonas vaginalis G3]|uniref:Ras-GAP domain-containing protein n=1 Tax=Trichomonas vaginalis (strain ATCC PRA-98 / G3) TaxID=412133 RepID=A2EC57_TRIV3|nr:GTPase activation domain, GAP family [Trichomonas vaginalis G3]EAY09734.1 hypothetical protein TVAG_413840 [Trichomonas vaginalis G3]KAI5550887.1 GTPase activation domain, GAP family [Trichomonas vaginalis G3]|eukprot:XP_001321957.1 hypothetical protein [Trichomonas vaginalis G3]